MQRRLAALLLALGIVLAGGGVAAASVGPPPVVDAEAALVATADGEVLHELDGEERLPMASITKLMTALVALDELRPGEIVSVDPSVVGIEGSSIYLQPNEELTVRDLLAAALIQSANDAAYALAAAAADGDVRAFVRRMNREADELGLDDTHYVNPAGLDAPGHYSSVRDIFRLAEVAMRRSVVRELVKQAGGTIGGGRTLFGWNDLLGTYPGLFGVKTGHTDEADWCQVAAARRQGSSVYAVILGSPSRATRNRDLAELLTFGLDHFGRVPLVASGERYATASVPFEEDDPVPLLAAEGADETVRLDQPLSRSVVAPLALDAPIEQGQAVGVVRVTQRGEVVAEVPLVAGRAVEEPGLGERVSWYAARALDEAGDLLGAVIPGL